MVTIVIYSHRINLSRRQTDADMRSAEKISLSGRRATDPCELSRGRRDGSIPVSCLAAILLKMI